MIDNDEQFRKTQRRTGNPRNTEILKGASDDKKEKSASSFEEMSNASDGKNDLKDETMRERKESSK
jgi:hypothetical protein